MINCTSLCYSNEMLEDEENKLIHKSFLIPDNIEGGIFYCSGYQINSKWNQTSLDFVGL